MSPTITKILLLCEVMSILFQVFVFFQEIVNWSLQAEITRWECGTSQQGAWLIVEHCSCQIYPIADLDASSHCIKVLKPHTEWIRSAIPSADGRLLLTCSDDHVGFSVSLTKCTPLYSFLQTAHITDIETAVLKTEMRGHDNRIECAVFVPMVSIPAIRELVALVTPKLLPLKL